MSFVVVAVILVVGVALVAWWKLSQLRAIQQAQVPLDTPSDDAAAWQSVTEPSVSRTVSNTSTYTTERLTLYANAPPERAAEVQAAVNQATANATAAAQAQGQAVPSPQDLVNAASAALKSCGVGIVAPGAGIPIIVEAHSQPGISSGILDQATLDGIEHSSHALSLKFPGGLSNEQMTQLAPRLSGLVQSHPEIVEALIRGDKESAQAIAQSLVMNELAKDGFIADPSASGPRVTINVKASRKRTSP